ncbi:MAG: AAA family ATPase [Pirellulales bacterium]
MYESFFGLVRRPFTSSADADCYYPATAIESARQTLFRCIDRGEGAALLIGPAGAGKSLLVQVLAEQFRGRFGIALLGSGRFNTRRELLQAILYELGLPYRDMEEGELRLTLIDHLSTADGGQEGMLLLIDEAHSLPLKLLEEVRLITNLVRGGQPKVRLVLAGSSALEERFTSPKLDAFNQRISARCYLQAFDRNETREYVKAQIEWAGGQSETLFANEALDGIYQATQGVPRLINQVCDHALLLACAAGAPSLDKASIEEAWADLQQLPTPWNRESSAAESDTRQGGEVIEFGILDDEPEVESRAASSSETDARFADADNDEWASDGGQIEIDLSEPETVEYAEVADDRANDRPSRLEPYSVPFQQAAVPPNADFAGQDPLRRLAEVEQQIAAIDKDCPTGFAAAPLRSHVQSSFGMHDPFNESFVEEELVIDPFAMTAADALANRPLVQCEEGRRLGKLLKPLPERASPKLSLATPLDLLESTDEDEDADRPLRLSGNEPAAFDSTVPPAIVWWPAEEATSKSARESESPYADHSFTPDFRVTGAQRVDLDQEKSGDPELIVIEDEPPGVHQVTVVRRGQYRQLFSNLRRG